MAMRTTDKAVIDVLSAGNDYNSVKQPSVDPYMRAANIVVNRLAVCATDRDKTLSTVELTEIETWLAAHFYVCSDQTYAAKGTDKASATFHGQTGKGLESSRYGQTALILDYSGCLAAVATGTERKVASGFWLGKPPSEQTDYVDRD